MSYSIIISPPTRAEDLDTLKEYEAETPTFQVNLKIPNGAACRNVKEAYDSAKHQLPQKIYAITKLVTSKSHQIKRVGACPSLHSAPRLSDTKTKFITMFNTYVTNNCNQGDLSKLMSRFLELCIISEVNQKDIAEFLKPIEPARLHSEQTDDLCDINKNPENRVKNLADAVSAVNSYGNPPPLNRTRSKSTPAVPTTKRPPHIVPTLFSNHDLNEQIKNQEAMRLSLGLPAVRGEDASPKNLATRPKPFREGLSEPIFHAKPISKEFFDDLPLLEKEALLQRIEGEVENFLKLLQGDHSKDSMLKRRLTYMALQWQLSNIELSAEAALVQNQTKSDLQGLGSAGMKKLLNSLVPPSTLQKMVKGEFKGSEGEKPKIEQINAAITKILDSQKSIREKQAIGSARDGKISELIHEEHNHFIQQTLAVNDIKPNLEAAAANDAKKQRAITEAREHSEFKDLVEHEKTGLVVLNATRGNEQLILLKLKQYHPVNNDPSKGPLGSSFSWHYFSTYVQRGGLDAYLKNIREKNLDGKMEFIFRINSGNPQVYARSSVEEGQSQRHYLIGDGNSFMQGSLFNQEVNPKHGSVPILDFRKHP